LLTRATLVSAGFHQHHRGAWRRCRHDHPLDTATGQNLS
jgi:hypothetical protein